MSLPVSKAQQELLRAFESFTATESRAPSVRELCRLLDRAPSTVHQLLRALEKRGLMRTDGRAHGWTTGPEAGATARVAIRGTIAAGSPIEAIEQAEECVLFPAERVDAETFALRVKGDSMIEDHILDGDIVIIRAQDKVDDGTIAVALLEDGSATLKRVFREPQKRRVRLQPANPALAPIYASSVRIQGKVIGVVRDFERT